MEFLGTPKSPQQPDAEPALYRALAAGDLPAAWLLARPLLERARTDKLPWPTAFNCAVCLYRLGEPEKALAELNRAEQSLGSPPDLEMGARKLFLQALDAAGPDAALLPLDPEGGAGLERYALIRVRWLTALCLISLERRQEAAPILRFLAQYHIEL